jgi:hypothetical protein
VQQGTTTNSSSTHNQLLLSQLEPPILFGRLLYRLKKLGTNECFLASADTVKQE